MFEASRDILGAIDLIADGEVIEVKTSARFVNQREADTSLQLTLYSWAYRMSGVLVASFGLAENRTYTDSNGEKQEDPCFSVADNC